MTKAENRTLVKIRDIGFATAALIPLSAAIQPALAHHAMGGATPSDFMEGLLSGLGHPIIGLDHFAFTVAVGLLSLACSRRYLMPLAFVAMTAVGTLLHVAAIDLPLAEIVIAISVLAGGALLIIQRKIDWKVFAGLFAIAGLFHGFAYGEAVVGAEATPVIAYLIGFAMIQYAISVGAMEAMRWIVRSGSVEQTLAARVAGGVVAGMALVFLSGHLMPF